MNVGSAEFYVGRPGQPAAIVIQCPAWRSATPQKMQELLNTLRGVVDIAQAEIFEGAKLRAWAFDGSYYADAHNVRTLAQWALRALGVEASQIVNG